MDDSGAPWTKEDTRRRSKRRFSRGAVSHHVLGGDALVVDVDLGKDKVVGDPPVSLGKKGRFRTIDETDVVHIDQVAAPTVYRFHVSYGGNYASVPGIAPVHRQQAQMNKTVELETLWERCRSVFGPTAGAVARDSRIGRFLENQASRGKAGRRRRSGSGDAEWLLEEKQKDMCEYRKTAAAMRTRRGRRVRDVDLADDIEAFFAEPAPTTLVVHSASADELRQRTRFKNSSTRDSYCLDDRKKRSSKRDETHQINLATR